MRQYGHIPESADPSQIGQRRLVLVVSALRSRESRMSEARSRKAPFIADAVKQPAHAERPYLVNHWSQVGLPKVKPAPTGNAVAMASFHLGRRLRRGRESCCRPRPARTVRGDWNQFLIGEFSLENCCKSLTARRHPTLHAWKRTCQLSVTLPFPCYASSLR